MRSLFLKISLFAFFFFQYGLVGAQNYQSNQGRFSVNIDRGCVPFTLNITTSPDLSDVVVHYNYDYDNNPENFTENEFHDYTTLPNNENMATIRILQVIGEDFDNEEDKFDEIEITLYNPATPQFHILQCLDNRIIVNIDDNEDEYEAYRIDFGDNSEPRIVQKGDGGYMHTYNDGVGLKEVTVKGLFNNDLAHDNGGNVECTADTKDFLLLNELTAPILQNIEVLQQDQASGRILINHELADHNAYSLEMAVNGSNFQHIQFVDAGEPSTTIESLDTENNYYCFRLNAKNACIGNDLFSEATLCSIILEVNTEDGQNMVSWQSSGFNSYQLHRQPEFLDAPYRTLSSNSFSDDDILCNQDYCYSIIAYSENASSSSIQICSGPVQSTAPPPALENVTASIEGNQVNLSWDQPEGEVEIYHIARSENNSDYVGVNSTTQLTYNQTENVFRNISYQVYYTDVCGNNSEPTVVKPVILERSYDEHSDLLEWNEYLGWANGVANYYLEISDKDGNLLDEIELSSTTLLYDIFDPPVDKQVLIYRVIAVRADGLAETFSNTLKVDLPVQAHFPNAFTPDGNGLNDEFGLAGGGKFVHELKLTIINRWGETVFFTHEVEESWNGYFKNNPAQQGTYIYNAEITDQEGRKTTKRGSISLIRTR